MSPTPYRRVFRSLRAGISGAALEIWTAADHLLIVTRQGFVELYKRFYFADIQAFVIQRTRAEQILTRILVSLAVCVVVLFGIGTLLKWPIGVLVTTFLIAALLALALIIHLALGSSCRCWIQTAVQSSQLHGLNRLPAALRVRQIVLDRVIPVQGRLSGDTLASAAPDLDNAVAAAESLVRNPASVTAILPGQPVIPAGARSTPLAPAPIKHSRGRAHEVLFISLLVDAVHTGVSTFIHGPILTFVSWVLFFAISISILTALILQSGTDLPSRVRMFTWTTLGYFLVFMALSFLNMFWVELRSPIPFDLASTHSRTPLHSPFELALNLGSFAFSTYVGLVGLLDLRLFRRLSSIPPDAPLARTHMEPSLSQLPALDLPPLDLPDEPSGPRLTPPASENQAEPRREP